MVLTLVVLLPCVLPVEGNCNFCFLMVLTLIVLLFSLVPVAGKCNLVCESNIFTRPLPSYFNIEREIASRIGQAAHALIWKSTFIQTKTRLKIYQSNACSILLYASETWRTNKKIESKLRGFDGRCLRRILHIWWEQRVTNNEVWEREGMNNIILEVKKRRWSWLDHVLRIKKERHPHAVLTWVPPSKRKPGRSLGMWRRKVEEMTEAGKNWYELRWLAQDSGGWRTFVGTLCSTGSEED